MVEPTTELTIVRHGETVWNLEGRLMNQLDSPLTARGVEQAERLAARLQKVRFDAFYSSDLGRVLATAAPIARAQGVEIVTDPELREHSLGVFAGHTWPEVEKLYPAEVGKYRTDRTYGPPSGESKDAYHQRTINCLSNLCDTHPGGRVLVVAHGGTLASVFRHVVDKPADSAVLARIPNGGLNVFEITGQAWRLRTWGDIAHLQP